MCLLLLLLFGFSDAGGHFELDAENKISNLGF